MAGLNGKIEITAEYRPCIVKEKIGKGEYEEHRAAFHHWSERFWTAPALFKNEVAGQMSQTLAIVEYEDGTVHECYPEAIRFLDSKVKEYCFNCGTNKNKDKITSTKDTPALAGNFPNSKIIFNKKEVLHGNNNRFAHYLHRRRSQDN